MYIFVDYRNATILLRGISIMTQNNPIELSIKKKIDRFFKSILHRSNK